MLPFLPSATKLRRLCFYSCLSVHGRGLPQCMLGCHPPLPGTVRILLECILVQTLGVLFVNLQKSFITRNAIISYLYFSFQQNHDPIPHDVVETFRQVYFIFRGNMMRGRGMPLGRGGPMRPMPPGMFKPGSP